MGELVPLSVDRAAWSSLNRNSLRDHGNTLRPPTPEQAARINDSFDIEAYVGLHGASPEEVEGNPHAVYLLPTQEEYQAAANVVEQMQPGDILFLEGRGFTEQPALPGDSAPEDPSLEADREEYGMHTWEYARRLAVQKGVQVVYADHDAYEEEKSGELNGYEYPYNHMSSDPQKRELAKTTDMQRCRKAGNTIKDYALDALPPEGAPVPDRKPKLVLLFGLGHKEQLEQVFGEEMGLKATVSELAFTSDPSERLQDKYRQIAQLHKMGRRAAALAGVVLPGNMAGRQP